MEKLQELLDEFLKEKNILIIGGTIHNVDMNHFLTKKSGFIERLVKNNKIERIEVWSEGKTKPTYGFTTEPYTTCKSIKLENTILMILSIQDNPIEYLCSILKE